MRATHEPVMLILGLLQTSTGAGDIAFSLRVFANWHGQHVAGGFVF